MSDFIDDGYTEEGYIANEEGYHGELEFTFRPALPRLADRVTALLMADKWEAFWDAAAKALASEPKLLQSWSLKGAGGQDVPITAANIQRLKPRLAHKLWSVVSGNRPSDPREGDLPAGGKIDLEGDAKNS